MFRNTLIVVIFCKWCRKINMRRTFLSSISFVNMVNGTIGDADIFSKVPDDSPSRRIILQNSRT